jgi:ferredoxin
MGTALRFSPRLIAMRAIGPSIERWTMLQYAEFEVVQRDGTSRVVEGDAGLSVMKVIHDHGFGDFLALCGGCRSCATCHVHVESAFLDKLPPMGDDENDLLDGTSRRQLTHVQDYIRTGQKEGAKLVQGGGRPSHMNRGFFIEPTIFSNVDQSTTIAREEIFGPVGVIIGHDGPDDAVRISSDTRYGLHGAVFTQDLELGYRVARQMRTGSVGFNRREIDWHMPFGGFKESGLGREGGSEGYRQCLELKSVYVPQPPSHLAV